MQPRHSSSKVVSSSGVEAMSFPGPFVTNMTNGPGDEVGVEAAPQSSQEDRSQFEV